MRTFQDRKRIENAYIYIAANSPSSFKMEGYGRTSIINHTSFIMETYTGGTVVAGPGSADRVGKGVVAHWIFNSEPGPCNQRAQTYRLLDITVGLTSWQMGSTLEGGRRLNDLGALDQVGLLVAEDRHLAEGSLESALQLGLVVWVRGRLSSCIHAQESLHLTNKGLPLAGSP